MHISRRAAVTLAGGKQDQGLPCHSQGLKYTIKLPHHPLSTKLEAWLASP